MTRRTRLAVLIISAAVALLGLALPAAAQPAGPTAPELVYADAGFTIQAWECESGNFCAWENTDGTGRRCKWSGYDPDWWGGSIICSWADDTPVESFVNNGTSTNFTGVQLYMGADYQNPAWGCIPRGKRINVLSGGTKLRSHRWVTYTCL